MKRTYIKAVIITGLLVTGLIVLGLILAPKLQPTNAKVVIEDDLTPNTLTIKKGSSVTWENKDSDKSHRIKSGPYPSGSALPGLDSVQNIAQGGSYTYRFDKNGSFDYVDFLHPSVHGTIIVR